MSNFAKFFKERNGTDLPSKTPVTESEKIEDEEEMTDGEYTKEDLLDLINSLDDEEANDLAAFIMHELMEEDSEDEEEDDLEESKIVDDEINEVKYFDKTKQKVRQEKHHDLADKKARARELKKYYKRNKLKIAKKAKKYRRRVKRHPERVVRHKG